MKSFSIIIDAQTLKFYFYNKVLMPLLGTFSYLLYLSLKKLVKVELL